VYVCMCVFDFVCMCVHVLLMPVRLLIWLNWKLCVCVHVCV